MTDTAADAPLAAGALAPWLAGLGRALRGDGESDVPCGGCTGCCTSSQFVHIGPDEQDTLAHVPAQLLFAAPGMPAGHVVLGYDAAGCCPMLVDGRCSIYEHRPRTCRVYDCRVFAATGVEVVDDDQRDIRRRSRRWRFDVVTADDEAAQHALGAASRFVAEHGDELPGGPPVNATQHAVLAVRLHDLFRAGTPSPTEINAALGRG